MTTALDAARSGDGAQLSMLAGDETARTAGGGESGERGPGRPKGARNRQTKRAAKLFMHHYGNPLDIAGGFLKEWKANPLEFTAKYQFKNINEAARFVMATVNAVNPYVNKRQPQEVEASADGGAAMVLMIPPAEGEGGSTGDDINLDYLLASMPGAEDDDDGAIDGNYSEGEENQ